MGIFNTFKYSCLKQGGKNTLRIFALFYAILFCGSKNLFAQVQNYDEIKRGSVYFSVGYDFQFIKNSSIHIQQDALNNDYTLNNVQMQDNGGNSGFSPSMLNYRLGYYFNYNQNEGIEISLDPCKYYAIDNQNIHISGMKSGQTVDATMVFSKASGNYYYMSNGLGKIQVNFTGRYGIYRKVSYNFALDLVGKAGLGAIMPTVDNSLEHLKNNGDFQLGGFNFGAEVGIRWISHRHFFLEFDYKYNYAMLSNIQVYDGWASQNISSGSLVMSLGIFLPTSKGNPLFDKGWAHRRRIINVRPMYMIDAQY